MGANTCVATTTTWRAPPSSETPRRATQRAVVRALTTTATSAGRATARRALEPGERARIVCWILAPRWTMVIEAAAHAPVAGAAEVTCDAALAVGVPLT